MKYRSCVVSLLASVVLAGSVAALQRTPKVPGDPPYADRLQLHTGGAGGGTEQGGDTPLTHLASFTGRVDVALDVVPFRFGLDTSGIFELDGLPAGAEVVQAWVLVTSFEFFGGAPVSLNFDGNELPPKVADAEDDGGGFVCSLFRFDVTPFVSGNGNFAYQATGNFIAYGDALVVVYEHPSLPLKTLVIHDGAESLDSGTSTTTFEGVPASSGDLTIFTSADNVDGVEEVRLNGELVLGPGDLFAANLGPYASLVTVPVMTETGENVLDVTTAGDWFGLHLAVLSVNSMKLVLDFETEDDGQTALENGQAVEPGAEFGNFLDIQGHPAFSGLTAAIFDSTPGGPNAGGDDPDLLVDLGNVLILQEDPTQSVSGVYDNPDDDASGGLFEIDFLQSVAVCAIDLVDLCPDPGQNAVVTLVDFDGRTRVYDVPSGWTNDVAVDGPPGYGTLDLTILDDQPGFVARATASEDPGFDPCGVVRMEVFLTGSGAIDNLVFNPTEIRSTVDFEDLGIAPGDQIDPPDFVGIASGGYLFEPTINSSNHDVHAGNDVSFWSSNGTTVLAGHDEILMTRVGGGTFTLESFAFAGWPVGLEVPFSVISNTGVTADFIPDGIVDGPEGLPDFESFELPDGFQNVESVLFLHTGFGTSSGTFVLDDLTVRAVPSAPTLPSEPPAPRPRDLTDPVEAGGR